MHKNLYEQISNDNSVHLKRNSSSLMSTSSSLKVKKIKLSNEFSPFHKIDKTFIDKKNLNFPIFISLFTNNYSINENKIKLKQNLNQKLKQNQNQIVKIKKE